MKISATFFVLLLIVGCGGGTRSVTQPSPSNAVPVGITLNPPSVTIVPNAKQQFIPTISMSDGSVTNKGASFSATGSGTIDDAGVFTAASQTGAATVTANAGSLAIDASVQVIAPTSLNPQYVQGVECTDICTLNATPGNALIYFLFGLNLPHNAEITLTDSQNDNLVPIDWTDERPDTNSGDAEFGAAFHIVGGTTIIAAPAGGRLFVFEYSGANRIDNILGGIIQSGLSGGPIPISFNLGAYVTHADNETVLGFAMEQSNVTLSAGVNGSQRFQFESSDNDGNIAVMFEDLSAPIGGAGYELSALSSGTIPTGTQEIIAVLSIAP